MRSFQIPVLGKANSLCKIKKNVVCLAAAMSGPRMARDNDIPGNRSSGTIRLPSR